MLVKHKEYPSPVLYDKDGETIWFGGYVPYFCEVSEEVGKELIKRDDVRKASKEEFEEAEEKHLAAINEQNQAQAEAQKNQE